MQKKTFTHFVSVCLIISSCFTMNAQRKMEKLDRGLVAVKTNGGVFLSWRIYGTDPKDIAFNIYRDGTKINGEPITGATNLTDANGTTNSQYSVKPIINGQEKATEGSASVWASQVLRLNLKRPAGGTTPAGENYTYEPNDINVGDLDGDGKYDLVVKWYPSNAKDNSQQGYTGNCILDAYTLDGAFMWRIDLGINIRSGAHYTQHLVADFDLDGKAEVICKTAEGTKDGNGKFLSTGPAANDNDAADYRSGGSWAGFVTSGPEYLTIFNGETGAEMQTVTFQVGRGDVFSWGKSSDGTNRLDRFNSTIAYLDGQKPSAVFNRGYYGKMTHSAWDWDGETLKSRWVFNSSNPGSGGPAGDGNHSIMAADIDADGFDEILTGAACIDHDGTTKWTTNLGHGDANHLGDLDTDNPGLEVYTVLEGDKSEVLIDARTGNVFWRNPASDDNGRGLAADIDARYPGYEMWSAKVGGVKTNKNNEFASYKPSINFRVYWDGDLQDELLDGNTISKWNGSRATELHKLEGWSCNGSKSTPNISADILGDWREEVILHYEDAILISTTTIPTEHKLYTLMHDPVYRNAISWQQSSYNQPPHLGFFLGNGTENAPTPDIELIGAAQFDCNGVENGTAYVDGCGTCVEGNTGLIACVIDCNGDVDGSAYFDQCGTCVSGSTGLSECSPSFQAEDACELAGLTEDIHAGYNGSAYANTDNAIDANIAFVASSNSAKEAVMHIRYANGGDADRPFSLFNNDNEQLSEVSMNPTGGWDVWDTIRVDIMMDADKNEINLVATTELGLGNIDEFWFNTEGVKAEDCTFTGSAIPLTQGWNLIGYPFSGDKNIEEALSSIWDFVEIVKDMDGFYSKDQPAELNSLNKLKWGQGYFVKVSENCELIWK